MIKYYVQPNGTGTAFMFQAESEAEAKGELLSLQNKGLASEAEEVNPRAFLFFASPEKLKHAFFLQAVYTFWNDSEKLKQNKRKPSGFKDEAQKFAEEKFEKMLLVNWLLAQRSLPEIYGTGKISAEKDSGDWKDVLTSVLKSC